MKDKRESGNAPHGDSHLRGGKKLGKQKRERCHGREHGRRPVRKRGARHRKTDRRSGHGQSEASEAFLKVAERRLNPAGVLAEASTSRLSYCASDHPRTHACHAILPAMEPLRIPKVYLRLLVAAFVLAIAATMLSLLVPSSTLLARDRVATPLLDVCGPPRAGAGRPERRRQSGAFPRVCASGPSARTAAAASRRLPACASSRAPSTRARPAAASGRQRIADRPGCRPATAN